MTIERLILSSSHNYFGHHDLPAGQAATVEVEELECVAGRGVRGDRFFDYKADYKGQITFFAAEVAEALRDELGLPHADAANTRRNVVTRGIDLNSLIGAEFTLQGVRFLGTEECRPCYWMNQVFGDSRVETWLAGRGGLRARILSDGVLRRSG